MKTLIRYRALALALGCVVASSVFADHWTSPDAVARAAHRLADAAEHFHRLIHDRTGFSHIANDAHRLADAAEHFHRAVEGGASYYHMINDFRRLQYQFQHVRNMLRRAHGIHHDPHVRRDWRHVQYAMEELEHEMFGGWDPDPHDPHDPWRPHR